MAPMYRLDKDHYLNTPSGLLTRYRRRAARRMYFRIEGIEPRAKQSMSSGDKDQVQQQVLDWLERHRRAAFRGPLALRLRLQTTDKAPTHAHNIAKNLLACSADRGPPRRLDGMRCSMPTTSKSTPCQSVAAMATTPRRSPSWPLPSATRWPICTLPHNGPRIVLSNVAGANVRTPRGQWMSSPSS
jgi:hypothetical protein